MKIDVRAICVFLPVLVLTWLFGFLAVEQRMEILSYLFSGFNGLQGIILVLFLVLLDPVVRSAWRERTMSDKQRFMYPPRPTRTAPLAPQMESQPVPTFDHFIDETDFSGPPMPKRVSHFYPRGFSDTDVMLYRELSTRPDAAHQPDVPTPTPSYGQIFVLPGQNPLHETHLDAPPPVTSPRCTSCSVCVGVWV